MSIAAHGDSMTNAARRAPRGEKYLQPAEVQTLGVIEALGHLPPRELMHAPGRIYAAGDASLLQTGKRVAIIGSREASKEGLEQADLLASVLAENGFIVVSGLAKGIDRAAHEGAMRAGGKTIAVIGTPLDRAYPAAHSRLQEELCRNHLVISQFALGSQVYPSNFVARNRTMALICHASIIIEAGDSSGSLSQAAETQRLGRQLFFSRRLLDRSDLEWPAKFRDAGAVVLKDGKQLVDALA